MTDIASHRGGAALWPENSATAFRETARLTVEQIEFDVQISADGVPVIFHDAALDRVTDGTGPLAGKTLSELKALSIDGGGGKILTLAEGLEILAPTHLVLRCEVKPGPGLRPYPGQPDTTVEMIGAHGLLDRTVFTSFHLPTVEALVRDGVAARDLIWLVGDPVIRLLGAGHVAALAEAAGIGHVSVHHAVLRDAGSGALDTLRGRGLTVGAFGVLEDDAIAWALESRLEVFTTDRPDAALRIREERRLSVAG